MKKIIQFIICLLISKSVCAQNLQIEEAKSKNWDEYSINKLQSIYNEKSLNKYHLGLIYLAHHDYKSARDYLKESNEINSIYYLAFLEYKLQNLEKALQYIIEYNKSAVNSSGVTLYIDILNDLGRDTTLEKLINELTLDKNDYTTELLFKLGLFYLSNNDCNKAIDYFKNVLTNSPESTIVYKSLAKAYQRCNNLELAEEFFQKTSDGKINSNNKLLIDLYEFGSPAFLLKPKMLRLIKQRKYKQALIIAEKLIKISTNDETIWLNYGTLLSSMYQPFKAIAAFEKAHEINQVNELPIKNLMLVYKKLNKSKSFYWADKLLKLNPEDKHALKVKDELINE